MSAEITAVIVHDPDIDAAALDAAIVAFFTAYNRHLQSPPEDPLRRERLAVASAILTYLEAVK